MREHTHESSRARKQTIQKLNLGNIKSFQKSEKIKQVALMAIAV